MNLRNLKPQTQKIKSAAQARKFAEDLIWLKATKRSDEVDGKIDELDHDELKLAYKNLLIMYGEVLATHMNG